jgi:hypothetical protein
MTRLLLMVLVFMCGVGPAWAYNALAEEEARLRAQMKLASQTISIMNEKLDCVADGECDVVAAGSNKCQGPTMYIVYSANNPLASQVKSAATDYTNHERELRKLMTSGGDCNSPPEPDARCVKNKCAEFARGKKW